MRSYDSFQLSKNAEDEEYRLTFIEDRIPITISLQDFNRAFYLTFGGCDIRQIKPVIPIQ